LTQTTQASLATEEYRSVDWYIALTQVI